MPKFSITTALARLEHKFRNRDARRAKQTIKKPHSPISVLNDDVLLHIFYIHQLHIKGEHDMLGNLFYLWGDQRWWYKLTHVSRRWRHVILAAPSLLDLHLVCTSGVPVADMLAHYPPLPLTIFYSFDSYTTVTLKAKDEQDALLALSHRDRAHLIALRMSSSELEKLFVAMDGEFPILESLTIICSIPVGPGVTLPRTFGAPNLSHVILTRVALPIQFSSLTTIGLVSLRLLYIPISCYFPPSYILTSLSLMPQLETLWIIFDYPVPSGASDVDTAITSHVTVPNLREFRFWGGSAYLEGLCTWMTAPVLSVFRVHFSNQLTFAVPYLSSFIKRSESRQFHAAELVFNREFVYLLLEDPQLGVWKRRFELQILCRYLKRQISSAIQILDALTPVLSVVEQVTLIVDGDLSSQSHNQVDRTQWRGLFRSFSNVRKLHVEIKLVWGQDLGDSLRTEDGEQPLELFPNLEEVIFSLKDDANAFTPFVIEREAVGRPVRLTLQSRKFWSY